MAHHSIPVHKSLKPHANGLTSTLSNPDDSELLQWFVPTSNSLEMTSLGYPLDMTEIKTFLVRHGQYLRSLNQLYRIPIDFAPSLELRPNLEELKIALVSEEVLTGEGGGGTGMLLRRNTRGGSGAGR